MTAEGTLLSFLLLAAMSPFCARGAQTDDPCRLRFERMATRRFVLDNELTLGEYVPETHVANVQHPRAAFDTNLVQVAGWCPCAHYSADVLSGSARLVFAFPDGAGRMEVLARPGREVSAVGATLKTVGATVPEPPFRLSLTAAGNAFSVLVAKDGRTAYQAKGVKTVAHDWRAKTTFGAAKFFVDTSAGRVARASSALSAGFGQADVRFVTTGRDKRLYFEGGRVFFTFSSRGPEALGVASFDPSRFDVRLEGTVLFDAGDGLLRGDAPADLFYDEEAREWRAWVCNFSTAGTVNGVGGREKGGVNCAWSKLSPLHGLTVMRERNMGLDGMNEDPTGFFDASVGKWRVFLSEFTPKGIRGSLWESDAWDGPFSRVTPPTEEDSTGQCLVELGGRRWAIAGSADQACHVYEYPSLKLHGDIRFDQPPWDAECPNGRVWGTLAVLPDGYAYKYLFLTMDRANFPGIPTPNWTYGALYLYGGQEP